MCLYETQILFLSNILGVRQVSGHPPKADAPLKPRSVPQTAIPESEFVDVPREEVLNAAVICFRRCVCNKRVVDRRAARRSTRQFHFAA